MKSLVLAFSTNQDPSELIVFCRSLRKIYDPDECDVVIATNRFEEYFRDLEAEGIQFISTINEFVSPISISMKALRRIVLQGCCVAGRWGLGRLFPYQARTAYALLLETWHHPHYARWFTYRRYLSLNRNYDQVLIADVRDVAFQAPFFDLSRKEVALYTELEPFGSDNGYNTVWYRAAWGAKSLRKASGILPVCMGTMIGPFSEMSSLVCEICEFFLVHPFTGVEQAVFNYMLVENLLRTPVEFVDNVRCEVATLSSLVAKGMTVVKDGKVCRASDGSTIPIVHMYDQFDDTKSLYDDSATVPFVSRATGAR